MIANAALQNLSLKLNGLCEMVMTESENISEREEGGGDRKKDIKEESEKERVREKEPERQVERDRVRDDR